MLNALRKRACYSNNSLSHLNYSVLLVTPQALEQWNPASGARRQRFTHPNGYQFSCCAYQPATGLIAIGVYTGEVLLIHAPTFTVSNRIQPEVSVADLAQRP